MKQQKYEMCKEGSMYRIKALERLLLSTAYS